MGLGLNGIGLNGYWPNWELHQVALDEMALDEMGLDEVAIDRSLPIAPNCIPSKLSCQGKIDATKKENILELVI